MLGTKLVTYETAKGTYEWPVEVRVDKLGPVSLFKAFVNSSIGGPKPKIGRMGSDEMIRFGNGRTEIIDLNLPGLPMPGALVVVSYPPLREQSLSFTDRLSGERGQKR